MSALTDSFTAIANAIRAKTGKSATMTPAEMPTEIASINTAIGNAAPADVLSGKTFSSEWAGSNISGSMTNYSGTSARTVTPTGGTGTESLQLAAGYHNAVIVDRTAPYNKGAEDKGNYIKQTITSARSSNYSYTCTTKGGSGYTRRIDIFFISPSYFSLHLLLTLWLRQTSMDYAVINPLNGQALGWWDSSTNASYGTIDFTYTSDHDGSTYSASITVTKDGFTIPKGLINFIRSSYEYSNSVTLEITETSISSS